MIQWSCRDIHRTGAVAGSCSDRDLSRFDFGSARRLTPLFDAFGFDASGSQVFDLRREAAIRTRPSSFRRLAGTRGHPSPNEDTSDAIDEYLASPIFWFVANIVVVAWAVDRRLTYLHCRD
jgi:hypothetical protein